MSQRGRGGRSIAPRTVMSHEQKLILASFVRDNKPFLIGKFSQSVSQKKRDTKWTQIYKHLVELGAVILDVDTLRYGFYRNMVKATVRKRDAAKSTGAAPPVYSDLDHIVLDILGADSAASNGIGEGNDQEDLNFQAEGEEELTGFDTTTESEFRVPISPRVPVFARKSAPPHASRTSSPIPEEGDNHSNGQDTQDNTQQPRSSGPSSNVKKRKIGPPTSILVNDEYKQIKLELMKADLEEKKMRMELMGCQIKKEQAICDAETERANFFRAASLSLTSRHIMTIDSETGITHLQM